MGKPDELAQSALYAASDDQSFANGAGLHVDGGMSLA
jgi:NAD(P)-dependent dehydrogenase (short-subunit alcohol dehydrogenase family)